MYFDAVVYHATQNVIFNGTPEETKDFLKKMEENFYPHVSVYDGRTLRQWAVKEYLAR